MAEFRNPNQDPNDVKRMLVVFALTFLAIIVSQQLMSRYAPKPIPPAPTKQTSATTATAAAVTTSKPDATPPPAASSKKKALSSVPATAITPKQATAETETTVENELYRITFTNKGAQVKSWILKKHQDENGNPLDLVNARAAAEYGYPLSLYTYDEALRARLNSALYVPDVTGLAKAPATITFEYADGDLEVRKSFSFDHSYVVKIETSVQQNGNNVAAFPMWPAAFGDQITPPAYAAAHVDWFQGDKVQRHPAFEGSIFTGGKKAMSNGNTVSGPFHWAGVVDQYFGAVFLPDDPASAALVELHNTIPQNPNEPDEAKRKHDVFSVLGAAVGNAAGPTHERLFVGPKNLEVLQSVRSYNVGASAQTNNTPTGPSLEPIVDFGRFSFISKPLFLWLNWTHDHWVSNWGWSIVVLTIVINLVLFPMRYTGMKSALLQQKIAPELKSINRKYEGLKLTDPRQHDKQKEVAELMKRENINQFAGCVPTLIQFPFLIAFYTMLSTVNELRHAHWLWITDLSSPDPWHLLPIVIVVTMFVMQRATPMTGMDESQAKMMQVMMPLMFGGISWSLPAGLGVYWVTGNLIGYGLQQVMNNTKTAKEIRAHLAKRAAKKTK